MKAATNRLALATAGPLLLALSSAAWADGGCLSADLNGDGSVNGIDIAIILGAWGDPNPLVDLSGNGTVDGADLAIVLGGWSPPGISSCVELTEVDPASAPSGAEIKLTGTFPAAELKNYSIVGLAPAGPLPMKASVVTSRSIAGKTGPVPTAQFCTLVAEIGTGSLEPVTAPIVGATIGSNNWSWSTKAPPPEIGLPFEALPPEQPFPSGTAFGVLDAGVLKLTSEVDLPAETRLRVWVRAHHEPTALLGGSYVGYDARIPCLSLLEPTTSIGAATAVAAAIEAVFAAHAPNPISVVCTARDLGAGTAQLTLVVPGLPTTAGFLIVEVIPSSETDCDCDRDGDGVLDCEDNCPAVANPDQADGNGNEIGDACETDLCDPSSCWFDFDGSGEVDGSDIAFLFSNVGQPCTGETWCCADLDGNGVVSMPEASVYATTYFGQTCP